MTGLVANLTTTTEFQPLVFRKGTYKQELSLVFCNTASVDNYLFVRWSRGESQSYLYYNYPILAFDTYPRDNSPFKITINLGDIIEVRSLTPGVDVSLVS